MQNMDFINCHICPNRIRNILNIFFWVTFQVTVLPWKDFDKGPIYPTLINSYPLNYVQLL